VLRGSLVHQDSTGNAGVIYPGLAQRMSAGTGILHSEKNDSWRLGGQDLPTAPVHFVQMWVLPDEPGLPPSYALSPVDVHGLTALASGIRDLDAAVRIHASGAALHVARLGAGETVVLPDAPRWHVFVARGSVDLEGAGRLDEGDAARFTADGGPRVTGASATAEVLVWQLP
jgi:redox-sensitive bicupin YhaK (pirin superfamily)